LPTDIERVIEQSFVVRAHVQDDGDGSSRIEPTDEGVYDGFGCGNAYALCGCGYKSETRRGEVEER